MTDNYELILRLRRAAMLSHPRGEERRTFPPTEGEGERPPFPPPAEGPGRPPFPPCGGPGMPGRPVPPPRPHRERERVLSLLDETEGVSQQKLALILGIRPQSLSELLGKLEKDGLLQRTKNPDDRRETLVSLTAAGRERAAAFETERRRAQEAFLAPLSETERDTLAELLEKLLAGTEFPEE